MKPLVWPLKWQTAIKKRFSLVAKNVLFWFCNLVASVNGSLEDKSGYHLSLPSYLQMRSSRFSCPPFPLISAPCILSSPSPAYFAICFKYFASHKFFIVLSSDSPTESHGMLTFASVLLFLFFFYVGDDLSLSAKQHVAPVCGWRFSAE